VGFRPIRLWIGARDRAFDADNPNGIQGRNRPIAPIATTARLGAAVTYQCQCVGGGEELDYLIKGENKFDVRDKGPECWVQQRYIILECFRWWTRELDWDCICARIRTRDPLVPVFRRGVHGHAVRWKPVEASPSMF
jgi:hypothetical protein